MRNVHCYPAMLFIGVCIKLKADEGRVDRQGKLSFKVEEQFCDECALALRRFIGHMEGIESIDLENKMITKCSRINPYARDSSREPSLRNLRIANSVIFI